ncbi:MAG: GGDEF domain-containing protein [Candidatus Margulisbacteria bacterium]|nr:GGDEF domain-containing protein [Candidatus Margulisiibacteriota bacterium]
MRTIERVTARVLDPRDGRLLSARLRALIPTHESGSVLTPTGKISPEYARPFVRKFIEVFGLQGHLSEEEFYQGLVDDNAVETSEPKTITPQDLYDAMVRSEKLIHEKEEEVYNSRSYRNRQEALANAIHDLHRLGISDKERAVALIRCVVDGLGYTGVRGYEVDLKTGRWSEFLTHGTLVESRFKDNPGQPGEKEEKRFLMRLLRGEMSRGHITEDIEKGFYKFFRNGQWACLYIPNRQDCYFADSERVKLDRENYPGGNVEEMMFLTLGDPKSGKVKVYQISNWGREEQPLVKDWEEDLRLLRAFAEALALTEENLALHEQVTQLSRTDSLTKLWTRGYFEEKLVEDIRLSSRLKHPVSLMMIDIDHFKSLNDAYGHPFGDLVLRQVSQKIKEQVRDIDTVARYGGEEIVIILPGTNGTGENARMVAERVRNAVAEIVIPFGDEKVEVKVSIGVTTAHPAEAEITARLIEELKARGQFAAEKLPIVRYADEALYQAKRGGRNCVVLVMPPKQE